ncbi:hypothetical protein DICVIV_03691 [Dictyocaulus viviparus]|uniref:Uncharacterized protein n=1 Tax=Dictyocaulus viviparus TaxID=29172 RepID=A0A0D8Y002_DICVI|nr:hypothetical protein DICVIV_03691 [Dictyocaulus viviparus]
MGSCPSNQCFIEKKPTEERGVFRITKGCLRRSPRTLPGCEYEHFSDHVLCVCHGCLRRSPRTLPGCEYEHFSDHVLCVCHGNFCNDHVFIRNVQRRNVTCRKCSERDPNCDQICQGQWCHEDTTTGASGCGFGPPSLPFFYKGPELLYYRNKLCITISRGAGKPHKHCICNTNMCNGFIKPLNRYPLPLTRDGTLKSRSLTLSFADPLLPYRSCVNCEINSHDGASITSSCKQNRCIGHFCTYASQRHLTYGIGRSTTVQIVSEKQGCINVTDSSLVWCSIIIFSYIRHLSNNCLIQEEETPHIYTAFI